MRIAIASGKGGTGKTTLAVNLAMLAADSFQVMLMDLDVEEPNSSAFIKGEQISEQRMFRNVPQWDSHSCTQCGKCIEVCQYNAIIKLGERILVLPELCHSCYACSELCPSQSLPMVEVPLGNMCSFVSGELNFIESKLDIGVEMAAPLISQSIKHADMNYSFCEYQFLDCPPGTSCSMITATKTADFVILITEPTPFGLYDLSLAVDTMRHLDKPFGVVVNRMGIGNNDVYAYCELENIPVLASIPNQRRIAELYSQGKVLIDEVPEVKTAMDAILSYLRGIQ
jgi:MinD superfamily P-loop ATPase